MKYTLHALTLATLGLCASGAAADTYTFSSSGDTVGTLEITDISGGALFSLTSSTADAFADSSFLLDLAFSGPSGTFGNYTGPGTQTTATYGSFVDAGTSYDWQINFDNAPPGDRVLSGMTVTWTITGDGLSADAFGMPMQLHIGAIDAADESVKIPAIPEPETYALMLAGLGMLAFLRRRQMRQE